jgi:hypothetical protein
MTTRRREGGVKDGDEEDGRSPQPPAAALCMYPKATSTITGASRMELQGISVKKSTYNFSF